MAGAGDMLFFAMTRFRVRTIILSMSRSMMLLNTHAEAITRAIPHRTHGRFGQWGCPPEAMKYPPDAEMRFPRMIFGFVTSSRWRTFVLMITSSDC